MSSMASRDRMRPSRIGADSGLAFRLMWPLSMEQFATRDTTLNSFKEKLKQSVRTTRKVENHQAPLWSYAILTSLFAIFT